MEKSLNNLLLSIVFLGTLVSCEYVKKIEKKAKYINNYEVVALSFAKENRELKVQLSRLEYTIKNLETQNNFLKIKLKIKEQDHQFLLEEDKHGESLSDTSGNKHGNKRDVSKDHNSSMEDLVKFSIYKWKAEQLTGIAENAFRQKDFEKAAQFFHTFIKEYPHHKKLNDEILFQAGVAAFKSQNHYPWTIEYLERLIATYPTSKFYRGSKLWIALSNYKLGKEKEFFQTVEEFRLKYRNTPEWKVLSGHYEEFAQKFKR